jgi:Spy/CpxP family protein refolding chaperone
MNNAKRITLATLAGGAAAAFSWGAFAHGRRGHGPHGGFGGPMSEERIEKMVKHFAVEVEATPEQQEKVTAIAKQAAKDLEPLRAQAMDARKQAMELLSQPTVDRAAIEKLRVSKLQHADAISRRMTQALGDAAEVLTPEQRKKLAEHMERRRGRWGRQRG